MKEYFMGVLEVEGSSDPAEKLFGQIALDQGLILVEAEMIKLPGKKENKWDKMSTVPDFLIKENKDDEGIYVEVTMRNEHSGNKNAQKRVMQAAGLLSRYAQITMQELENIKEKNISLIQYIKDKIAAENGIENNE
jgi:hypothetical protein